jgi:hypothetical protein
MAFFLLGIFGCNKGDNKDGYGSSYDKADPNVPKKTVTDSSGRLLYFSEYGLFGIDSSKSPDADDNEGINIDSRYVYLIKGLKEKLTEDIDRKVTFSGKYYPSDIVSPVVGTTIFYITDITLNYE